MWTRVRLQFSLWIRVEAGARLSCRHTIPNIFILRLDFHIILLRIDYYSSIVSPAPHSPRTWKIDYFISVISCHLFCYSTGMLGWTTHAVFPTRWLLGNFSKLTEITTIFPLRFADRLVQLSSRHLCLPSVRTTASLALGWLRAVPIHRNTTKFPLSSCLFAIESLFNATNKLHTFKGALILI